MTQADDARRRDLEFVLAGLDSVDAAMRTGNQYAAGIAFAELRQSVRRALDTTAADGSANTEGIDASTTLDQRQNEKPEPARDRRKAKRASSGV